MARYQILRRLATGGMAEVFLGRAIGAGGFQKPVAIKRILPNLAADKDFVTRFRDEARLTVHLQHANVVQVFDLGQTQDDHLMVLEFVEGETLRSLLREAGKRKVTLPAHQAAFIIQQVAEGLAYAHEVIDSTGNNLNIVHRDINPANVMVSSAGEVKLADFGIARAALAQSNTATGVVRGKAGYFPPEIALGADPDQRSDVFLVGLLLYEVLAGKRLFAEQDFVKSLVEVGRFDISALYPPSGVPRPLWDIVVASLNPNPNLRMPSARQLSLRLSTWLFENRLRVGPNDIAKLFATVFPGRKSSLDFSGAPLSEVTLAQEPSGPTPAAARRRPALSDQDFALPAPVTRAAAAPPPAAAVKQQGTRPAKQRLGDLLLSRDTITPAHLDQALAMQKRVGGLLGDVLVSLGFLKEDDLYAVLAEQRGQRYVRTSKLEAFDVPESLKALLPGEAAQRLQVLPLSLDDKRHLYVAMVNPADLKRLDEVSSVTGIARVIGVMIRPRTLEKMLERTYLGRVVALDLPPWVAEQSKMIERFGATTSDPLTKSREQVFGEDDLNSGAGQLPLSFGSAPAEALLLGAAATEDALGVQAFALLRLVRALSLPADAEKQAMAMFVAGQLEQRRPFEAPLLATVRELLAGASDEGLAALCAGGTKKPLETKSQQVLAALFAVGEKLGGLEAPSTELQSALLGLQHDGRVPVEVIATLAKAMQPRRGIAIIGPAGSAVFAVAPRLVRAGYRVITSTSPCFERAEADWAIIDATMSDALDVVKQALAAKAKTAVLAPVAMMPVIGAFKSLGVNVLNVDDLGSVARWLR